GNGKTGAAQWGGVLGGWVTGQTVGYKGEARTTPYLPPRHFAECHNRKRTVDENLTTGYL
ncbi:hypothetical protein, partial [Escherichia coli]|uniref:hypothetical protein n=1 Tax=Escherichia coli TaxID=562 RepID=UPI001BB02975